MKPHDLIDTYRQLQDYVGWRAEDARWIERLGPIADGAFDRLVEDFYAAIVRHRETARVLTGGEAQIARLKVSLRQWLSELFSGQYDVDYVDRRWRVGRRHVEIGLEQSFVSAALSRLRQGLVQAVVQSPQLTAEQLPAALLALHKMLDLDLALIDLAYQTENLAHQQPLSYLRMRQQAVLLDLSERALDGLDMDRLGETVTAQVAACLEVDRCKWLQLHREREELTLAAGYGCPPDEIGDVRYTLDGGGPLARVLKSKRPVVFEQDDETLPGSCVCVPVHAEERAYGVLGAHAAGSQQFDDASVDFLQAVANVLAAALQRAEGEAQLRESESRLARFVEHLPAAAVHIAPSGLLLNRAIEQLTGFRRAEIATLDDWFNKVFGDHAEVVRGVYEQDRARGFPESRLLQIRCRAGDLRTVRFSGHLVDEDEVWLLHDITELQRAQQRAVQNERLAAIGQMITALAHESRNALQRIQSSTELLEFEVEDDPSATELVERIQLAQDDLHRLFDEVRNFAAPITIEPDECELPSTWREAWGLLEAQRRGRDAQLIEVTGAVPCCITADRFRLVQVFRNLFENSLAACDDPVEIQVGCERVETDGQAAIRIRIGDNGPGLSPEVRENIFAPFFTTKSKGTGLGMPIALRVIQAHGGTIEAGGSSRSPGAEFVITLPQQPS